MAPIHFCCKYCHGYISTELAGLAEDLTANRHERRAAAKTPVAERSKVVKTGRWADSYAHRTCHESRGLCPTCGEPIKWR